MSSNDPSGGYWDGRNPPPPPPAAPPGYPPPPPGYPPPGYPPPPPGYPPPGYPQPPGYGWQHGGPGWGAPQAPKPGIIPLRPLGLGELLDGGFALIRRYPAATLGLSALVMFVVEAIQLVTTYILANGVALDLVSLNPDGTESLNGDALARVLALYGVIFLTTLTATVLLTGMLTAVVGPAVLGQRVTPGAAWQQARALMWRLLGAAGAVFGLTVGAVIVCALPGILILLVGAAAGGGLADLGAVLTVIGGLGGVVLAIYIHVSLEFTTPIVMLEKQGVRDALRRSRSLVSGSWWRVLGITVLAGFIAQVVAGVIGLPFSIAGAFQSFSTFSDSSDVDYSFTTLLLSGIGGLLGATISRPFAAGVGALLYVDQRMRREALDLTLQQAAQPQS
jgi:hypothetical protein